MAIKSNKSKSKKDLKKVLDIAQNRKVQKLNPNQKLSLCMIVKNEEENLDRCLKSVENIVDEIIIVDTGSSDKTIEIANKYDTKVFYYEWENDFGKARNESIKYATGDWILVLDADEELEKETKENIRAFLIDIGTDIGYQLKIRSYNINNDLLNENYMFRLFKRSPNIKYSGRIHEMLSGLSGLINIKDESVSIIHHGYKDNEKLRKKLSERNIPMLELAFQEKEDDTSYKSFINFYLGSSYFDIGEIEKALKPLKESIDYILKEENKPIFAIYPYFRLLNIYTSLNKFNDIENLLEEGKNNIKDALNVCDYWYYYAILERSRNNIDKSIEYFKISIETFENEDKRSFLFALDKTPYYYSIFMIAELYFELGNYNEVKKYLDKCKNIIPEFSYNKYIIFVANLYQKINEFDTAIELYNYLLNKVGVEDKNKIKNLISNAYLKENKFSESIKIQSEIHDPEKVKDNWYHIAQTLEDEKIFKSSEEIYSTIIEILPMEVEAYLGRTVSRLVQNKVVEALSDLALARKLSKSNENLMKIAILYIQIGQLNQAQKTLDIILLEDITNLEANLYMASIEQSEGKIIEASNRLNSMISIYPENTKPYIQLGNLFISIGKIDEAENIFDKVIEIDVMNVYSYYAISICNIQKANKDKALIYVEKALDIEPANQGLIDLYENIKNS